MHDVSLSGFSSYDEMCWVICCRVKAGNSGYNTLHLCIKCVIHIPALFEPQRPLYLHVGILFLTQNSFIVPIKAILAVKL